MSAIATDATESRPSLFAATLEPRIVKLAAMADESAHAVLHVLADTPTKVVSALRDPYSNVFLFTEEGNPIQISGRPGSRPFFTATDFANIFSNQSRPRK